MSRSKNTSTRSRARGIASRKRTADCWLSRRSLRMLSLVSNSIPRLSASSLRSSGLDAGANSCTFWGRPSSSTWKSSSCRSETSPPRASRTVTVTLTRSRSILKTGGCWAEPGAASRARPASATADRVTSAYPGSLPQRLDHPDRQVHFVEGRHDVDALRQLAGRERRLLRDLDALELRALARAGDAHALADVVRDAHAGHLVVEELGVLVRVERQDPDQERHVDVLHQREEALERLRVVDGLRHDVLGAGLHLLLEPPHLLLGVRPARVGAAAH